jgi:hypothetical protein
MDEAKPTIPGQARTAVAPQWAHVGTAVAVMQLPLWSQIAAGYFSRRVSVVALTGFVVLVVLVAWLLILDAYTPAVASENRVGRAFRALSLCSVSTILGFVGGALLAA